MLTVYLLVDYSSVLVCVRWKNHLSLISFRKSLYDSHRVKRCLACKRNRRSASRCIHRRGERTSFRGRTTPRGHEIGIPAFIWVRFIRRYEKRCGGVQKLHQDGGGSDTWHSEKLYRANGSKFNCKDFSVSSKKEYWAIPFSQWSTVILLI